MLRRQRRILVRFIVYRYETDAISPHRQPQPVLYAKVLVQFGQQCGCSEALHADTAVARAEIRSQPHLAAASTPTRLRSRAPALYRRCLAVQIAPPARHPELARCGVGGKEADRVCHVYFRDADTGHGPCEVALGKAVSCYTPTLSVVYVRRVA